jgi:hypothetical protein
MSTLKTNTIIPVSGGILSVSGGLSAGGSIKNDNPAFEVTYTGTPSAVVTDTLLVWNSKSLDVTGSFNTSNGKFTAPYAGRYFFSCNLFFTINGSVDAQQYGYWKFAKNDVHIPLVFHSPKTTSNYINHCTVSGSIILNLAASDTISVVYRGSPYEAGYSNFNGHYIG